MLGALLDDERAAGRDVAFLFSDIHPAFYERLGFITLPSRAISLRATSLDGSPAGGVPLEASDWPAFAAVSMRSKRAAVEFQANAARVGWMRGMWSPPFTPRRNASSWSYAAAAARSRTRSDGASPRGHVLRR